MPLTPKNNINTIPIMLSQEKRTSQHLSNASLIIDATDNWKSMILTK